ncbi:MAG: hypothetical protein WA188_18705 [Terriglobales bacterium]
MLRLRSGQALARKSKDPYFLSPSLRSGFWQRAQTPAKRLNFDSCGQKLALSVAEWAGPHSLSMTVEWGAAIMNLL